MKDTIQKLLRTKVNTDWNDWLLDDANRETIKLITHKKIGNVLDLTMSFTDKDGNYHYEDEVILDAWELIEFLAVELSTVQSIISSLIKESIT